MKNKYGFILLMCILIAASCKKNNDSTTPATTPPATTTDCSTTPAAAPTSNSPVAEGSTIMLSGGIIANAVTYHWTGPNGFSSTDHNPSIPSAISLNGGTYTLTATLSNGCVTPAGTTIVMITVTPPPCTPSANSASGSGISPLTFGSILGAVYPPTGFYRITANGSNGDLFVEFGTATQPTTGTYPLYSSYQFPLLATQACVGMTTNSAFWTMGTSDVSQAYVTVSGGKVTVSFCSVTMSNSTWGTSATVSGSITEQ